MRFEDALRLDGLRPRDILADGRRRRCATDDKPKRRNGQYVLLLDGRTGFWRNFAVSTSWNVWKDDSVTRSAPPPDPEVVAARRAAERQERIKSMQVMRDLWASGRPFRRHQYLTDKGLSAQGCAGLRLWNGAVWVESESDDEHAPPYITKEGEWLLVPMLLDGRLVNVQRIHPDGMKRQMKGCPQVGAVFSLVRPGAALTVFVEGLATGLAVYQSVRHATVHVTFFADNLLPVIDRMRPSGSVVIAADNDHRTAARGKGNPGIEKAINAASLVDAGVAWPRGIEGTDWADALMEWGDGASRRIEREILAGAKYVIGRAA